MKRNAIVLIVTISLALLLSPAVSLAAASGTDGGGQGVTDMPGHNMDMSSQGMEMSGNGPTAGGGNVSGMDHGSPVARPTGNSGNHNNGANEGHNPGGSRGGSEVNSQAVMGGFGLINGLIILSAAMLKRKSFMAGGN